VLSTCAEKRKKRSRHLGKKSSWLRRAGRLLEEVFDWVPTREPEERRRSRGCGQSPRDQSGMTGSTLQSGYWCLLPEEGF